ncbi:uncharacterized protein LOC121378958 [Gigantopelta aegis]|uniref:uncharacterized protein LOC121378958 n=1 Tax=Gigantopelta aegis TaxID=1735272 RepID=UPI001B889D14|nr:uncharacterized protein LOC121378958 [Gigantopelta aegis]
MKTDVSPCSLDLPPPPHLGGLMKTYGMLIEYRVSYTGSRATVTLVYGDRIQKKGRWRKRRRVPAAAQGESKPVTKPPAATPSVRPPNTAHPSKKTRAEEVPDPDVQASLQTEEPETELDTEVCVTPYNRPPAPIPSKALPDVSPIILATPVEAQARKVAVVKRRATAPPGAIPAKPSRPSQPPESHKQPVEQWSLQASRLPQRYHQLVKYNIQHLISRPKALAYNPLPDNPDEGEFAVHRLKMRERHNAVCVTICRRGFFSQGLLLSEMDNPTLHRVLKTVAGTHYRSITEALAASDYRQFLPQLETTGYIGTP